MSVCLCPSRCFCSVVSPVSTPQTSCVCLRLHVICCFCSNQTERRSVADVRGGLANSSSPPMRRSPAHFTSPAPHTTPHTHTPLAVRRTILAADIVLRHDGNMADCSVVSFNPDYESIVCDLDWVSCTICCFLLFCFEEPMESWWRRSALLSALQHLVVGMSVQISDCMWSVF